MSVLDDSPRVMVVGEALPSSVPAPVGVLGGRFARRVGGLAGRDGDWFMRSFRRVNLCPSGEWSQAESAATIERLGRSMTDCQLVIEAGARVSAAIVGRHVLEYEPHVLDLIPACVGIRVPHPSGRNRYWNVDDNVAEASMFWRLMASVVDGGRDADEVVTMYYNMRGERG